MLWSQSRRISTLPGRVCDRARLPIPRSASKVGQLTTSMNPSPFDRVPNELVEQILSLVPLDELVQYDEDDEEHNVNQTLLLMQICHRFRRIMHERKFWREGDFQFESLLLQNQILPFSSQNSRLRLGRLCHALFNDSYFRSCLQIKSEWTFTTLESLFAVLTCIIPFQRNTRSVSLYLEETDAAISRLTTINNLIGLTAHCPSDSSLNLSNLANCLPHLKSLRLDFPLSLAGSLMQLTELEELSLQPTHSSEFAEDFLSPSVLPTGSAEVLSRLSLTDCCFDDDVSLRLFTSLKHLTASRTGTNDRLDGLICDLPAMLVSLDTDVYLDGCEALRWSKTGDIPIDSQWPTLSSPCLRHLQKLCLYMFCGLGENALTSFPSSYYVDCCLMIIEQLTRDSISLEDVELWAGMDLERVHVLNSWRNLKSLKWIIPAGQGYIEGGYTWKQDLNAYVVNIFHGFPKIPKVSIEILEWDLLADMSAR